MSTYTLKSNNVFLRCLDMGAIEVCELDSPYLFPVKGKSWEHLDISIGPGKEYEALKIADKDISDVHLQELIKEVFNSRLIVNREGLCFVASSGVTAAALKVEYYRLFDLFDWSKYQVNSSLTTRWVPSDFVDGHPLDIVKSRYPGVGDDSENVKKVRELEKELENEKSKLKEAVKEAEAMKEELGKELENEKGKLKEAVKEAEAMKEEVKKKDDEIKKLKEEMLTERKKQEENTEELKKKKAEFDDLNNELKLYSFDKSSYKEEYLIGAFYKTMLQKFQVTILPSKVVLVSATKYNSGSIWPPTEHAPRLTYVPLGPIKSVIKDITFEHIGPNFTTDFDRYNWKAVRVAVVTDYPSETGFILHRDTIAYYDGNRYQTVTYFNGTNNTLKEVIPIPCSEQHMRCVNFFEVAHILGVGARICSYSSIV